MENKPSLKQKLSSWFIQYKRVWSLLRKPTVAEYKTIAKVSAIGILVIGALGFVISVAMTLAFS